MTRTVTPSQTVGPFFGYALPYGAGSDVAGPDTAGAFLLHGRVLAADGEPVPDALVEIWQADPDGHFDRTGGIFVSPEGFRGFGRCATDDDGRYWFRTVKPGAVPTTDGRAQAPHIAVVVFARGLLRHVATRAYFPDEAAANETDPLLRGVDEQRRGTLVVEPDGDGGLRFDIRLQDGPDGKETVFLDVFGSG